MSCPNCGSDAKPTTHLGREVCVDCVMDVAMDIQAHHWSSAMSLARQPFVPRSSGPPRIRHNSGNGLTRRPGTSGRLRGDLDDLGVTGSCSLSVEERRRQQAQREVDLLYARDKLAQVERRSPAQRAWRPLARKLSAPSYNAVCLLCGRIWYGSRAERCKRCKGTCTQRSDHDLGLMGRHPQAFIEGA